MTEDFLLDLIARQRIETVLIDYCAHLDRMDLAALGALFTTDCRVIYGDSPALQSEGRAALEESLARMWRWQRTAHHLSNVRIRFQGDATAQAESCVLAWHEAPDGHTATLYGRYIDRLVQRQGNWLIAERRMEMNGSDSGFACLCPRRPAPAHLQDGKCPKAWTEPAAPSRRAVGRTSTNLPFASMARQRRRQFPPRGHGFHCRAGRQINVCFLTGPRVRGAHAKVQHVATK
tara:strand:- start:184 stop:882 length:699 start_codon:yes stop_codon:yes gene_type:complete